MVNQLYIMTYYGPMVNKYLTIYKLLVNQLKW